MLRQRSRLAVAVGLSLMLIFTYGCAGSGSRDAQLKAVTLQIQKAVQSQLDSLDRDLSAAASELSRTGLSGPEARQILNRLPGKYPFIIDCCTADLAGKMVAVAPDAYSHYGGTDISSQTVTVEFNQTKEPALSQIFPAVEGMDAVVIMWPVVSDKGALIGSVSTLFKPETLLAAVCEPVLQGTGIALTAMQLDGLAIYDSEGGDTGKNLFTDPGVQPYTELVALGHRMASQESGTGSYAYFSQSTGKTVEKQAYWVTVKLHDTAWRLMAKYEVA